MLVKLGENKNKLRICKHFVCLGILIVCSWLVLFSTGWAKTVAVLPFEINAKEDLSYLKNDLPALLNQELKKLELRTVPRKRIKALLEEQGFKTLNLSRARDLAILANSEYSVYGSFNQAGSKISLDVRLVNAFEPDKTKAFYVQKEGLINILPAVQELAGKVRNSITQKNVLSEIKIKGNKILGKDFILMRLQIQEGTTYSQEDVNREIKRLFKTGYFEDVKVYSQETPEGIELTFEVKEKPLIKKIQIQGNEEMDDDDILEVMSTKTGSVLNPKVISDDLEKIREMYRKKGYYMAKATYEQESISPGQAKLVIKVQEGKELYIEKITISGAEKLDPGDLKDELALSERGMFSWITGGGVLKEQLVNRDAAALEAYYANRGFMDVQVGQPEVDYKEDGIYINFQVIEGPRYKVGGVDFQGDLIFVSEKLKEIVKMDDLAKEDEYFDRSILREDTQSLSDYYSNYGYAFADANVQLDKDEKNHLINIQYVLNKKQKVYINRVHIAGNYKTRDNVIRRQMELTAGEQFSGRELSWSKQKLQKLDYFEKVEIQTTPTSKPEELDLKVNVKEKSTGSFSAGAGYSSTENVFFTGQVQERNLMGKGYTLTFSGSFSTSVSLFELNFWNPHLYDGPLGVGMDAYNTERDYDEYDLATQGGKLKFAYTIGDYTRLYWNYKLELYEVDDLEDTVSQQIRDINGENWSSSLYGAITRDTSNRRLYPTKGTKNTLGLEYAGGILAGDDNFIKTTYDFSYYQKLFWEFIFNWHWQVGYLFENTGEDIPDFERFYLGGIDDVRGYDYRDISCQDEEGEDVGGYKTFFTNLEIMFPVKKDMGLMGLIFADGGDVWDKDESISPDLYKSVGLGIRWNSPMGPLRLEYGIPLDELKDNSGKFEFSVGQFF